MNVVILQPSYIAWRGYFDQMRRADLFIFHDDVRYDKHGWRNRDQIKTAQGKQWLTIPIHIKGVTNGMPIKEVRIDWSKPWAKNDLGSSVVVYNKAPHFKEYLPRQESTCIRRYECLVDLTLETSIIMARQLGFTSTRFICLSRITGIEGRKTDRVINVLKQVGTAYYCCDPLASSDMEPEQPKQVGVPFESMQYNYPEYPQYHRPYVSILFLLFVTGEKAGQYF